MLERILVTGCLAGMLAACGGGGDNNQTDDDTNTVPISATPTPATGVSSPTPTPPPTATPSPAPTSSPTATPSPAPTSSPTATPSPAPTASPIPTPSPTPVPDTTAPVISLLGNSAVDVIQGESYTDAGASATDNVDTAVMVNASNPVDTTVLGTYTITYNASDVAGNLATPVARTVNVVAAPATLPRAHRLLLQTTFGPVSSDLDRVQAIGTTAWIDEQLAKPSAYDADRDPAQHRTHLERTIEIAKHAQPGVNWDDNGTTPFNQSEAAFTVDDYQMAVWWENALGLHPTNTAHGSDQLRQRVAYALSQLLVTSAYEPPLHRRGEGLAAYYDILAKHAFGNYRDLLGEVARSPAMGIYLSHQGNRKADTSAGTRPDENFAREIMQLFTIGLYQLNSDGTPDRDSNPATLGDAGDSLVPSYTQGDIEELAKVMTGWDLVGNTAYGKNGNKQGDYTKPMEFTAAEHEQGDITLLGQVLSLSSGLDNSGMDAALDVLFKHQNMGPYVSKHLIMRLVTSNPSAAYINRVATVFNDDGNGVRGNLKAVVRAILVDYEARGDVYVAQNSFGKFKEPLLAWAQLLRATGAVPLDGWIGKDGSTVVNGVYWLRNPQTYLGQAAMRSPSVFNFYNPDYVPSDVAFSGAGRVGPEMQIQTDQIFLEYNNRVRNLLLSFEKNEITVHDGNTLGAFAGSKSFGSDPVVLVNFDKELAVFSQALGGDYDNIDTTDSDGVALREKAVDALLVHLDALLLGETMTAEYKAALTEYLVKANGLKHSSNFREALNIIRNAVRLVVTSGLYMVQK